jgi:hypothetical protein
VACVVAKPRSSLTSKACPMTDTTRRPRQPRRKPDIVIPAAEGTLFGPVRSVRSKDDADKAIERLLGPIRAKMDTPTQETHS